MNLINLLLVFMSSLTHHHHHPAPKPVKPAVVHTVAPAPVSLSLRQRFYQVAGCESSHEAHINTGNGFYGAFQFDLTTWRGLGRVGLPSDYSYESQLQTAVKLYNDRGSAPWPVCGRYL